MDATAMTAAEVVHEAYMIWKRNLLIPYGEHEVRRTDRQFRPLSAADAIGRLHAQTAAEPHWDKLDMDRLTQTLIGHIDQQLGKVGSSYEQEMAARERAAYHHG